MRRYWINLRTLQHRINEFEYAKARADAEEWLGDPPHLGWFASVEAMNNYIVTMMLPVLEKAWRSNPHQRLGQLISNATPPSYDPYYIPDGELLAKLKEITK